MKFGEIRRRNSGQIFIYDIHSTVINFNVKSKFAILTPRSKENL
jgi:hypothetical protein